VIKTKTDEMGEACSKYRMKGFWWGNTKERIQIDERTLPKLIINLGLHGIDRWVQDMDKWQANVNMVMKMDFVECGTFLLS
jgi:hypothetical protein